MVTRIGIDSPTHDVLSVDGAEFRFGCHGGLPVEWDGDDRGGLPLPGAEPLSIHRQAALSEGSAEQ